MASFLNFKPGTVAVLAANLCVDVRSGRSHVITPPDRWLVSLTLSEQKEIAMKPEKVDDTQRVSEKNTASVCNGERVGGNQGNIRER